MRVLGIETSCDETGVAIFDSEDGLLAQSLYSQVSLHAEYGGVVPELASRDHIRKLVPLVRKTMVEANTRPDQIDGLAYTAGPGLIGALMTGASLARGLAFAWERPAIGVHHLEGHLLAPMLEDNAPEFPFVALLVSGGHTMLVRVKGIGEYRILGETLDDAAGEAFDKTAKMLGLPYPGGPELARLAEKGLAGKFELPRPMTKKPGLDFSFSGLKTAVLVTMQKADPDEQGRADLAHEFQEAVVDTLVIKSLRALDETGMQNLVIAGGVGANKRLRQRMKQELENRGGHVFYPRPDLCTDNGAMIAYAGLMRLRSLDAGADAQADMPAIVQPRARWPLDELTAIGGAE